MSSLAIILDKSSFQMLNQDEIVLLHNYYLPNITPILVMEVLGDLSKEEAEGSAKAKVTGLAMKLLPYNSAVNIYFPKLIEMELRGEEISMDHRPIVGEIVPAESETGKKGFHIEESSEEKLLSKWRAGEFTNIDGLISQLWRDATTKKDLLENLKSSLKERATVDKKFTDLKSLAASVDVLLTNPDIQVNLLEFIIAEFGMDAETAKIAFSRWSSEGSKMLSTFGPYSYYCCRVKMLFYLGLKDDLLGTRPTNNVDLQYLYYLPFTSIFSSNDKFHRSFIPLLVSGELTFITGEALKKDLRELVSYRATLFEKKDIERTLTEPPRLPTSLTYQLWERYFNWPPKYERKMSEGEIEEGKRKMDEFIAAGATSGVDEAVHNPEFITKTYYIGPEDFCPCGSGKKFKNCHLPTSQP